MLLFYLLYHTSLKVFISCKSSLVEFLGSLMNIIVSSVNRESLTSYFPFCISFNSFCCLIILARTLSIILNSYGEGNLPCVISDFSELPWVSLHLIWCWLFAYWILLLYCLSMFLVSLGSPKPLSWRGVGYSSEDF